MSKVVKQEVPQPRFWAKTGKGDFENGQPKYHPVICHLADTAVVAMEIVRSHLRFRIEIK